MRLILARHGNTFGPGDTPVWVGAKEDLPLVEKGEAQSAAIADYLERTDQKPGRVIAGPLLRTRRGAEIIVQKTRFSGEIEIEERLKEIDYGSWGGCSDAEIEERYGAQVITDWREHTIVPEDADWSPSPAVLKANATDLLSEIIAGDEETVLLISSNGTLRYFHAAIYEGVVSPPSAKVKTGHICLADWNGTSFEPIGWNIDPAATGL